MVVAGYLFSSWRLKEGGTRMTDVFVSRYRQSGGSLILNQAVEKIRISNGKVTGVNLSNGETLDADGVVAAIHPKILLAMLSPGDLRQTLQERIWTLEETDGVLAVQASVDAAAHPELGYNIYRLSANDCGLIEDGVFYQIRKGDDRGAHLLSIITRSLYEDWRPWENTRTGKRGEDYESKKLALGRDLLVKAEGVFGPLKNARILDVFTPLTLRDYVNCPEGSCYGVLRSARQLLKVSSLHNLPIGGLCLAGQNALAPGVLGSILGSFAAVRQILGQKRFAEEFHPKL
jgi:phytoene dehydrogenase-like protein